MSAADESPRVDLKIKGLEDGNLMIFKTEKKTPLEKLMSAYSNWVSVDCSKNRFFFNGREISADDTPDVLGMEDGDEMHALRCHCGTVHVKKPENENTPRVLVNIKSMMGEKSPYRIKRESPLIKLMEAYCERESWDIDGDVYFVYGARRIQGHQTPDELGMKDGDKIYFMLSQRGS